MLTTVISPPPQVVHSLLKGTHALAVVVDSWGSTHVKLFRSTVFAHNSAVKVGGAVYIEFSSKCTFKSEAILLNNKAGYSGGSISIEQSNITFRGSVNISESKAIWAGGAVALTQAHIFVFGTAYVHKGQ